MLALYVGKKALGLLECIPATVHLFLCQGIMASDESHLCIQPIKISLAFYGSLMDESQGAKFASKTHTGMCAHTRTHTAARGI